GLDRAYQFAVRIGFHYVGPGSRVDDVPDELVGEVQAQNQDFRFWQLFVDSARRLQPIQVGHAQAQDNDVRLEPFGKCYGLSSVLCLSACLPAWPRSEQLS